MKVKNKFKVRLAALLLLFPGLIAGQELSFSPATFPVDQNIISIVSMSQDSKRQIWIASNNNGLFKYDGIRLTSYKSEINNLNNLPITRLECVFADSKDNIWVGTFQDGLEHFDPETETFTYFKHNSSDTSSICCDSIRTILEDENGFLWIGTAKGLDIFNTKTGKFSHLSGNSEDAKLLSKEHIRSLFKDRNGVLWIGCGSPFFDDQQDSTMGGLYKLIVSTGEIVRYKHINNDTTSLIDNRVRAIFEDSRGVMWVGTSGDGLHIMDREKGTFKRLRYDPKNPQKPSRPPINNSYNYANDHITFINEDAKGYIWIGTFSGGLNRYNPETNTVQHFGTSEPEPYKLNKNDFWCSLLTNDGLFWIASWAPTETNQILYKVFTSENQLNYKRLDRWCTSFYQQEDGTLWIGSLGEMIRKNTTGEITRFPLKNKPGPKPFFININPDDKNNLWVATTRGLFYFNTTSKEFREYKYYTNLKMPPNVDTIAINTLTNSDGTIWIGTTDGLVLLNIESGDIKHYTANPSDPESLTNNIVDALFKDKNGNLWVGTNSGLNKFNAANEGFDFNIGRQININCIYKDKEDNVWVGTANLGLYILDPQSQTFTQFIDSTHILDNNKTIYGLSEDHDHSLLLNTAKGFVQLKPKTKIAVLFGKSWNIDTDITANPVYTTQNGQILIGDQFGYYHFLPENTNNQGTTPKPYLSKIFVGGKQVNPGTDDILKEPLNLTDKISISYNQNNFAVEFNCIDFITEPSEKNMLYKLENYDDNWRKKIGEENAYYYNVPPGKYVFKVKASNLYGNWGEKSLVVNITPPWYKTRLAYILFFLFFLLLIYSIHRFQKSRVIKAERERTHAMELQQAREIEKAYAELKSTQSQLIQSEKMASLGELTAGIAHEIQNPLNFVNNFSEVSAELLDELKEELDNGETEEVKAIADDVIQNLGKILHHGRRADGIVKNMLLHSRGNTGEKLPTDINALADEYLRLSYHGLRAKDKTFNADFKLEADESLRKIDVVPQDIGRVLLNLFNNAFYAVSDKLKKNGESFKPSVVVTTQMENNKIKISVADNGNGISDSVKEKIFQPFFTTKPAGVGTGLGLSLSYDIIKAHGGELKLNSKEGKGTEFIIVLPINSKL